MRFKFRFQNKNSEFRQRTQNCVLGVLNYKFVSRNLYLRIMREKTFLTFSLFYFVVMNYWITYLAVITSLHFWIKLLK